MLYHHLRFFNAILTIFGLKKCFINIKQKPIKVTIGNKLWTLFIIACMILGFVLTVKPTNENIVNNLIIYYKLNNLIANVIILILNIIDNQKACILLYEGVEKMFRDLNISEINCNILVVKYYFGIITSIVQTIIVIILECIWSDPFILLITIPVFLSILHLVIHLYLFVMILKLVRFKMSNMLTIHEKPMTNCYIEEVPTKWKKLKYLLNPKIKFMEMDCEHYYELKFLCKVYDSLSTNVQLLQQHHGIQMLLTFWLLFSNTVFGVTLVACKQVPSTVLVAARSIFPFYWCYYSCYINGEMTKEVEKIDLLIVKYLIDFKCDPSRKIILQTFKQLVTTNRLQFTACSLFHLNYSMILGTIVNVITYSIILIQLFLNDK